MTPDVDSKKELEPRKTFVQKLQDLSKPAETVVTIDSITDEDVLEIRTALQESGFRLDISEDDKIALKGSQIRNPNQGRGIGIVAATEPERAQRLFEKCEEIARAHNWKQRFPSSGIGVGLKHTMADILSLAVLPKEERERIVTNLNNRVLRGLGKIPKKSTQSTNPPESVIEVWQAMTSK